MASAVKIEEQLPPASPRVSAQRVEATLNTATAAGLMTGKKTKRVSGRAHEQLFAAAAERSGLQGNELLEYALAKVALEDNWVEQFFALEGTVSRDLDLDF